MIRTTFIQKIYIALAFCTLLFGGFFVAPAEVNACEIERGGGLRFRTNVGINTAHPVGWFDEENPPYVYIDIPTTGCDEGETTTVYLTLFGLGATWDAENLGPIITELFFVGDLIFGPSPDETEHFVNASSTIHNYTVTVGSEGKTIALFPEEKLCYGDNNDENSVNECLVGAVFTSHPIASLNPPSQIVGMIGGFIGPLSLDQAGQFSSQWLANIDPSTSCMPFGRAFYSVSENCQSIEDGWNKTIALFGLTMPKIVNYFNSFADSNYQVLTEDQLDQGTPAALLGFPGMSFDCDGVCAFTDDWSLVPNGWDLEYGATHSDDAVLVNPFSDSYQEVYTPLAPLPFEGLNGGDTGDLGQYLAAIFRTAIVVLVILAVLMLVFYGFAHATVDSITKKDTYREKTWNILYALLLALGAWLLLNTISPNLASNLKLTIPNVTLAGDAESVSTQPITTDNGTITGFQLPGNMNIFCEGSGGSAAVPSIIDSFENKVTYRYGGKGGALGNGQNFVQSPGEGNSGNYMCNNNGQQVPCRSFCPDQSICLDCSGFVNHVRQCAGLSIYAGTTSMTTNPGAIPINTSQITNNGQEILINGQSYTFQPGDLLVWKGHVVIYYGNGYIAESKGDLASFKNPNTNIKKSLLAQSSYLSKITHLIKANP